MPRRQLTAARRAAGAATSTGCAALAVLIMIEAHVDRQLDAALPIGNRVLYGWSMILGGLGAPLFLFLAGSPSRCRPDRRRRRSDARGRVLARSCGAVSRSSALAFLFRRAGVDPQLGAWRSLLKVDILNIMGPSIMAAAALWGAVRSARGRLLLCRSRRWRRVPDAARPRPPSLDALPDPIEAYFAAASRVHHLRRSFPGPRSSSPARSSGC